MVTSKTGNILQELFKQCTISVDPYMRGRMNSVKSYAASFEVDQPIRGGRLENWRFLTFSLMPSSRYVIPSVSEGSLSQ